MTDFLSIAPNWRSLLFLMLTALITILIFALTDFVGTHSRIGNTFEAMAVEIAENAAAKSKGISTDEMKSRIKQKCFQAIVDRSFEEGRILSSSDQRQVAERACRKIASAGLREINAAKEKLRIQFWSAVFFEVSWRLLLSLIVLGCIFWITARYCASKG